MTAVAKPSRDAEQPVQGLRTDGPLPGLHVLDGEIAKRKRPAEPANSTTLASVTACPHCGGRSVFGRCRSCGARQMLTIQPEVLAAIAAVVGVATGVAIEWIGLGDVASVCGGAVAGVLAFGMPRTRLVWRRDEQLASREMAIREDDSQSRVESGSRLAATGP